MLFLLSVVRFLNFGTCRFLTNSLHCFPFTCLHISLAFMSYLVISRNSVCASCTRAAFLHPPSFGIILLFKDNELIAYRCYARGSPVRSFGAPWLGLSMAAAHLRKLGCRWSCLDPGACGGFWLIPKRPSLQKNRIIHRRHFYLSWSFKVSCLAGEALW